jgi:hypothetical protein
MSVEMSSEVSTSQAPEAIVENEQQITKKACRPRNFSFLHKKADTLDDVEINGKVFKIPAAAGSCYWALLKVFYESHDQPVYLDDLCNRVASLMEDRDDVAWQNYINKSHTTVQKTVDGERKRAVQKIKTWQERVINNAKTLTRLGGESQYGMRLYERGHVLRYEYDSACRPYFILHTNLECLKKESNARQPSTVVPAAEADGETIAPEGCHEG